MSKLPKDLSWIANLKKINHFSGPAMALHGLVDLVDDLKVIELGTGYGAQLPFFAGKCKHVVTIDAGYDWVPDLKPEESHDEKKLDQRKLDFINSSIDEANAKDKVQLIIGSTYVVHENLDLSEYDVLVIDACHHPGTAVKKDYDCYKRFLAKEHILIFDDINQHDPRAGMNFTVEELKKNNIDFELKEFKGGCSTVGVILVKG